MLIPTQFPITDPVSQIDAEVQRKLLREYEQKFAEQQKLTKLCSNAVFLKNIDKGQLFITLGEEGSDDMKTSCREYTLPRSDESSRVRGWIHGNTKIGPVVDVKVCYHQGSYGVEIMIESLFRDRTVSCVRIVNGINKYVTETSEEILVARVENRGTGKHVAKAELRPKPTLTFTPVSIPYREQKRKDVDPGKNSQGCFEVSKFMIRLLRHDDTAHRKDDGAVRFDDLAEKCKAKFDGTSQWPMEAWITLFAQGGGPNKRFQYCLNPNSSKHFLYFRVIQGHSGGQRTVTGWLRREHLPHRERSRHGLYQDGLIPGGKSQKGQAVSVFHSRESDVRQSRSGRSSIRSGQTQNRRKWNSLKEKDCSSIKPDRAQLLFSTYCLWFVLKNWQTWRLERIKTAKYINPKGFRESYSRQMCNTDVRILLIPSRSEKIHRPSQRAKREVHGNLSLTSRGHTSQASRSKSAW